MGLDIYFYKKEQVGYFRKVNFLVAFFEKEGYTVENCQAVTIEKQSMEKLIDYCRKVLDNHSLAPELLPTREGFFFGSLEYDEWYFKNVQEVLNWAQDIIVEFDNNMIDLEISY